MKRRLRRLIVFAGVLGLVMAVNVGVASADHGVDNPNSPFVDADAAPVSTFEEAVLAADEAPSPYPVGQNALGLDPNPDPHPGQFRGFGTGNAEAGITNNPNCPLHYLP